MNTDVAPQLTILIVSWNSRHYLEPCLASIRASDVRNYEILVVDNGSVDGSVEFLRAHHADARIIANAENIGHTRAVNIGFAASRGALILVMDADTEVAPDALGLLVRYLDEHPEVGVVAPRTFNSDGSVQESARRLPTPIAGLFGRQSWLTRLLPNNSFSRRYLQREQLDAAAPFRVESVASSCMLLRRSLVERHGAWDEGFPGYFVETDWCCRMKRAGEIVCCIPAAKIVHHEQNCSTRRRGARRIWMFHAGALRYFRKNHCAGPLDPRLWAAAALLTARAGWLMLLDRFKAEVGRAPEASAAFGGAPLIAVEVPAGRAWPSLPRVMYRGAEIALAVLGLVVTAPIMLVEALIIKMDSPGPVLFFHERVGRSKVVRGSELVGRKDIRPIAGEFDPEKLYYVPTTFRFVKFRTMYADAAQRFPDLYAVNFASREEFEAGFYKYTEDPRVTRVGRWMRQLTIDEFPNFWNVLTGKVGLVGPRPEGPSYLPYYSAEEMYKFTVRPGVTGLAQINGRGYLTIGQQLRWDLLYIRSRSVALDLGILLRTLYLVLIRRGAF
jgi:lipopolysaccharide/colanic/teichoic acid biosynthesis glycosyltransferase/GT2 family glycosyltransferase